MEFASLEQAQQAVQQLNGKVGRPDLRSKDSFNMESGWGCGSRFSLLTLSLAPPSP